MINITPHPKWLEETLEVLRPLEQRIVNHRLFEEFSAGRLSLGHIQKIIVNFYPLVETFPKYMALSLAKVPPSPSDWILPRRWLIKNINQERLHSDWWKNLALGFGVPTERFEEEVFCPPEMDAINNYLWRICTHGSLAEGMAASNYSVEGPTGVWTKSIQAGFQCYADLRDVQINKKTLEWVIAHARYDDQHPLEALEIIKVAATSEEEQSKVKRAATRALEYYAMALDRAFALAPLVRRAAN